MLELTGFGSILRGLGILYWVLAVSLLALALWKGKGRRGKALWASAVVVAFGYLPVTKAVEQAKRDAYAREAWAYFKKKCDTESGERIYKTLTNVRSVLITKPLPPATEKDLFDQYWYGDPYSDATPWNRRGEAQAVTLLRRMTLFNVDSMGLDFVEIQRKKGERYMFEHLSLDSSNRSRTVSKISTKPVSTFAVSWEDISTTDDRKYWVAGSRLRIQDMSSGAVVAERIGFFIEAGFGSTAGQRRPWLTSRGKRTTCPPLRNGTFEDRLFILRVLNPSRE
jgi:hypothetical protein